MKIILFFKKLFYRIFKRKHRTTLSGMSRWCGNCTHTNKGYDEEPCCYCDTASDWEPRQ